MKKINLFLLLTILLLSSCKNQKEENPTDLETKYILTPFSQSPEFPDATLIFDSYTKGLFTFRVESETYILGEQTSDANKKMCANSPEGQHIHLIMGSDPYYAKYTETFKQEIRDGTHYMLAFLSRSYHESIKTSTAFVASKVEIENNTIINSEPIEGMMLWYSRPKGVYVGKEETDKVMLDFYLKDVELGEEYKILADINGEIHTIDQWIPYYIKGLPLGFNKIKLTLVDMMGEVLPLENNPVSMEFELKEDPADALQ
ncbi:MAG TPA: hypothetical protein PKC30_13550 [Saprospiraceae bacterium]|nr:hypothetical protein [Saprospiraceae bacterium]